MGSSKHRTGIVIVGLGPLGRVIALDAIARDDIKVIGAIDPAFAGEPLLGVLSRDPSERFESLGPGIPDIRVAEVFDGAAFQGLAEAALVATVSDLGKASKTFRRLLGAGLCVVSTCEELLFPILRHPELTHELDELARAHCGQLLGTGVNPGFVMDALTIALSGACRDVRGVAIERIQDASTRRIPFQKKIGATLSPSAFEIGVGEGWLRHVGLGESLHLVAHSLGWAVESWSETIEPVLTDETMDCGLGKIPSGHARGVRQVATGIVGGHERLRLEFVAAIGEPDPGDRIHLDADPPISMRIEPNIHGDIATSAIAINALRSLASCPPGLHTMADIPLVRWRSAGVSCGAIAGAIS